MADGTRAQPSSASDRQSQRDRSIEDVLVALQVCPLVRYDSLLSKLLISDKLLHASPEVLMYPKLKDAIDARKLELATGTGTSRSSIRCPIATVLLESLATAQQRTGVYKFYKAQKRFSSNGLSAAQRQKAIKEDDAAPARAMTVSLPSLACFLLSSEKLNAYLLRRICCMDDPLQEYAMIAVGLAMARDYGRNLRQRLNVAKGLDRPITFAQARKESRVSVENNLWGCSNDFCITFAVPAALYALMQEVRIKSTILLDFTTELWLAERMNRETRQVWFRTLYPVGSDNTCAEQDPGPRVDTTGVLSNCSEECRLSLYYNASECLCPVDLALFCALSSGERSKCLNLLVEIPTK